LNSSEPWAHTWGSPLARAYIVPRKGGTLSVRKLLFDRFNRDEEVARRIDPNPGVIVD
jgi:hypothetical protein